VKVFNEKLREITKKGLLRKPLCIDSSDGAVVFIKGKRFLNFSSNDYLGLSSHPEVVRAVARSLRKHGFGSGASRLLSGTSLSHKKLEERIAQFKKTAATLLFNTGYAANTGIIPALAEADTVIFSDELNHASIIDGIRLSRAEVAVYNHRDTVHLESLLTKYSSQKRKGIKNKVIITDTIFSMDGDIAPLNDIISLCRKYRALLMIDDAHATGVLGKTGRGGLEHFGIKPDNIIQMGTLSKAAGCYGGFAAGSKNMITLLTNRARSFIYSTSLPPAVAEAGVKAIDIIDRRSKRLRKRLWDNRKRLYQGLQGLGFNTLGSETPIIPIFAGNVENVLKIGNYLFRHNIFAPAIRPPTVPEGMCRVRFSVTAAHTDRDIDYVLEKMEKYKASLCKK
jgi:8-amino-7-oxononanoate synthase